jgi:hypothetical protein
MHAVCLIHLFFLLRFVLDGSAVEKQATACDK